MRGTRPSSLLMITELFLPTKGGTAVSFDDDFRRLGGKDVHIVTADVPGAADFDRSHPNSVHRLTLKRSPWLKPESLVIYSKLFLKSLGLGMKHRFSAVFAGRALPEGIVAWALQRAMALIFDEYDAGRPDVMFVIQRILEREGKFTLTDQNRVISPHPYFRLFATANTVGLGNLNGMYHGAQKLNHAQIDR